MQCAHIEDARWSRFEECHMTHYQRQVRSFHFREQIALWDMETKGVFILSWREARQAWRNASRMARSYPPEPRRLGASHRI
jgi:hypothetical protein